jgi:hypothetical protein
MSSCAITPSLLDVGGRFGSSWPAADDLRRQGRLFNRRFMVPANHYPFAPVACTGAFRRGS